METKNIHTRLFEAKKEIGKISKDSKNPFFKSNYLSLNGLLEAVEPVLKENELLLLQPIINNKVSTQIIDIYTSELVYSDIDLPNITDPQKLGSAITYYRRYTLQSLLGLQAEDDDANSVSKATKPQQPTKPNLTLTKEGFEFLTGGKATKEQINQALNERTMTTEQKETLTKLK